MTDETMTPEELKRVDAFFSKDLPKVLDKVFEQIWKEDPSFIWKVFSGLIQGSLESLKHYIENPEEESVSWENPWVELHYPMEWDWEDGLLPEGLAQNLPESTLDAIMNALRSGEDPFKAAREATWDLLAKVGSEVFSTLPSLLLQNLTHNLAVHVQGGREVAYCFLDPKCMEEVEALETEEERTAYQADLLKKVTEERLREPFCIGGLEVLVEEEGKESVYILAPLRHPEPGILPIEELRTTPKLLFNGEVQGVPFQGSVVLMVHPLIVDEDKKEAYFPIVTGLVLSTGEGGLLVNGPDHEEIPDILNPSTWPEEDRADLWECLLEDLPKKLLKGLTKDEVPTPPASLVPTGAPPPQRTIGVSFGNTLVSVKAQAIVRNSQKVRLPNKWSSLRLWDDLVQGEVDRLLQEEGERAFDDLKKITKDKEERGPLLMRRYRGNGEEVIRLTSEGQERLREREGLGKGFIFQDNKGRQSLVKLYRIGSQGLLEIGLSWDGLAGPLVEEWRRELRRQSEKLQMEQGPPALWDELNEERRKKIDRMVNKVRLWEDGRKLMEAVLGQVGIQRRNPVEIPAEAFRVLLWPDRAKAKDWPQNWKQRVEDALRSLHALTFHFRTYRSQSIKGYGSFIGEWEYFAQGKGGHGDGVYLLDVQPGFLGCLRVFESGKTRLKSGREAITYHFSKELTKEEKETLGWGKGQRAEDSFTKMDAGRPWYDSAAGLTSYQKNLLSFLEENLTLKRDTAKKENKKAKVHWKAEDANECRRYTSSFCPLIPEGEEYYGSLGHFRRNPEAGFTLGGTESRPSRHVDGMLVRMGFSLPAGGDHKGRRKVLEDGVQVLKDLVVNHLGGIVAGHNGAEWVHLEHFLDLDTKTLTRKLRVLCFLPTDYNERRRERWEEVTGRRATENLEEAERDAWGEGAEVELGKVVATPEDGFKVWPLHKRLRGMMKERGLRQKDLAALFGVTPPIITYWLKGTTPDERGKKGKPIPKKLVPLVTRWVETGVPPTEEELKKARAR